MWTMKPRRVKLDKQKLIELQHHHSSRRNICPKLISTTIFWLSRFLIYLFINKWIYKIKWFNIKPIMAIRINNSRKCLRKQEIQIQLRENWWSMEIITVNYKSEKGDQKLFNLKKRWKFIMKINFYSKSWTK